MYKSFLTCFSISKEAQDAKWRLKDLKIDQFCGCNNPWWGSGRQWCKRWSNYNIPFQPRPHPGLTSTCSLILVCRPEHTEKWTKIMFKVSGHLNLRGDARVRLVSFHHIGNIYSRMMSSKKDIPIQFVHCPYFVEIIPVVNVCRVILCIATINSKPLPVIINHFIILQMGWGESHQCNLQGKLMTNQQLIFSLLHNYFIKVILHFARQS